MTEHMQHAIGELRGQATALMDLARLLEIAGEGRLAGSSGHVPEPRAELEPARTPAEPKPVPKPKPGGKAKAAGRAPAGRSATTPRAQALADGRRMLWAARSLPEPFSSLDLAHAAEVTVHQAQQWAWRGWHGKKWLVKKGRDQYERTAKYPGDGADNAAPAPPHDSMVELIRKRDAARARCNMVEAGLLDEQIAALHLATDGTPMKH